MKAGTFFVIIMSLFLTACGDKPIVDYVEGTWALESYHRNGTDETSLIKITDYVETYSSDGIFTRSYTDGKMEAVNETGTYLIDEDNRTLHISGVSSISDFSDAHSTLSTSLVMVVLIDETELAYSFENGGDEHEFRFLREE